MTVGYALLGLVGVVIAYLIFTYNDNHEISRL